MIKAHFTPIAKKLIELRDSNNKVIGYIYWQYLAMPELNTESSTEQLQINCTKKPKV